MRRLIWFFFLLTILTPNLHSQEQQPSLEQRAHRGLMRSDLQPFLDASNALPKRAYEVGLAIRAAGLTNDPFWVPYLKPFLKYARTKNPNLTDLAPLAQLALAKLGETQQLEEIACEANFGSASMRDDVATHDLPYLKGWFSISLLSNWLNETYKADDLLRDKPGGDEVFLSPPELALKTLSKLLPDAPIPEPSPLWVQTRNQEKLAPLRQAWRDWISQNEESLRKLAPSGDGVDSSRPACKRVLAQDRIFNRSRLTKIWFAGDSLVSHTKQVD